MTSKTTSDRSFAIGVLVLMTIGFAALNYFVSAEQLQFAIICGTIVGLVGGVSMVIWPSNWIQKTFVVFALVLMASFCGIIISFVRVPELLVILGFCVLMALIDTYATVFFPRAASDEFDNGTER